MNDAPVPSVGGAPSLQVYPDATTLAQAAAAHWVARAKEAIAAHGRFAVALSGGSTPRATYALLATPAWAGGVEWARVHVFWGDERCVPPDHPESNYRLAREALLDHVPLPRANVHRIPTEREPAQAAAEYERTLRRFFGPGSAPRFDLVLLGLGADGHTASLFPGTPAVCEYERWVVAHYVSSLAAWRVTLTPAVLNAADQVTFLVAGAEKAGVLDQVLTGAYQPDVLPAQVVRPASGSLLWLVDAAARAM
jgi:6-phosphogluconolactonase